MNQTSVTKNVAVAPLGQKPRKKCPICGSTNIWHDPKKSKHYFYCNHCGHTQFD